MNIYELNEEELSKFVFESLYDNIDNATVYLTRGTGEWAVFKTENITIEVFADEHFATYCGEPVSGPFSHVHFKIKQGLFGIWLEYQNNKHLSTPFLSNKYMDAMCELMINKLHISAENDPHLTLNRLKKLYSDEVTYRRKCKKVF